MLLRGTNEEMKWSSTKSIFISEVRRIGKLVPLRILFSLLLQTFPSQRASLYYIYVRKCELLEFCSRILCTCYCHFVILPKLLLSIASLSGHWFVYFF